jgi:hypothetical protein
MGRSSMTGDQSRLLKAGTRICWENEQGDKGTIVDNGWSAVKIKWDTGFTSEVMHNDMTQVQVVK